MPMDEAEALKLGAALIGGGAAGAVITAIVTSFRNRVQPVRYRMKTVPVFADGPRTSNIETIVTLKEKNKDYSFTNLFLTELSVVNIGNQDIKEFMLGITMDGGDQIVNIHCTPPNRHHVATTDKEASPAESTQAVDYKLSPFNRKNPYSFRILSTCLRRAEPGPITLSSSAAVRFVRRLEFGESLTLSSGELLARAVKIMLDAKFR